MFYYSKQFLFALFLIGFVQVVNSQELRINEIVSSNITGLQDKNGDYSDWIELHNYGNSEISLKSYYLSDKAENPLKWNFPDITLAANGYILVFASEKNSTETELHANFKLLNEGETIFLSKSDGSLIDQMHAVKLIEDISYGYKADEDGRYKYFSEPTPKKANTTTAYLGYLEKPTMSMVSGFYPAPINVSLSSSNSGTEIRYTIDGADPTTESSLYSTPLNLINRASEPNVISLIPTNPSFNYPFPGYDIDRVNTRGWLEPYGPINKSNVLRARAFKSNYIPSTIRTESYFINPEMTNRYSLPVMSITTDNDNLFSDEYGIYVYGTAGEEGNYNESSDEWERPVLIQFFEKSGTLAFEQTFGARIHGGGGRHSAIKNLRMYARNQYGKSTLEYKWFENIDENKFKTFLVRGPGHRPDCFPRDDLSGLLLQNLNMDIQHLRHVIVFINGEYWGIHTIKERFDQDYLEEKYGKKSSDYVILRNSGSLDSGETGDDAPYNNLLDYVQINDMSLKSNYDYVKQKVDIDNYLNYFASEVYLGNVDWVNTNIKFWRYKGFDTKSGGINGLDGKWRWFLFDFDLTFGSSCSSISPSVNVLDNSFDPSYGKSTVLARGLKQNQQFVFDFVNRICDLMNSNFSAKNINLKINQIDQIISREMLEHVQRWRYPAVALTLAERQNEVPSLTKWNSTLSNLRDYTKHRKRKIIDHLKEEFTLADSIHIELNVNDLKMGNIQINSIIISEKLDGVSSNVYPWHGTYFKNVPFQLIAIPKLGYRFKKWQETNDTNDTLIVSALSGVNYTAIFEKDPEFVFTDVLFINEFMAQNNQTFVDEFAAYSDWIELYNPNNKSVDLKDFFISDDVNNPYKYKFPQGFQSTIIPPHAYKIIWADDRTERGPLHTNFRLSASGEHILLSAPDSTLVDEIAFGIQTADISYGREKDGFQTWKFFQIPLGPTPGTSNNSVGTDELDLNNSFVIFPNPVTQGRSVQFSRTINIEVFNMFGQRVYIGNQVSGLDTNEFNKGIYLLKTDSNLVFKLIIR